MTLLARQAERTICFSRLEELDEFRFITKSRRWLHKDKIPNIIEQNPDNSTEELSG